LIFCVIIVLSFVSERGGRTGIMKKFINEFKEFALKGNMMDLAVGIIIGSAFTAIVSSLVDDIINPFLGLFTGAH